ncbi:uncharacterized protein METZ01_LOCUS93963, partial [marine metagenome]
MHSAVLFFGEFTKVETGYTSSSS